MLIFFPSCYIKFVGSSSKLFAVLSSVCVCVRASAYGVCVLEGGGGGWFKSFLKIQFFSCVSHSLYYTTHTLFSSFSLAAVHHQARRFAFEQNPEVEPCHQHLNLTVQNRT